MVFQKDSISYYDLLKIVSSTGSTFSTQELIRGNPITKLLWDFITYCTGEEQGIGKIAFCVQILKYISLNKRIISRLDLRTELNIDSNSTEQRLLYSSLEFLEGLGLLCHYPVNATCDIYWNPRYWFLSETHVTRFKKHISELIYLLLKNDKRNIQEKSGISNTLNNDEINSIIQSSIIRINKEKEAPEPTEKTKTQNETEQKLINEEEQ